MQPSPATSVELYELAPFLGQIRMRLAVTRSLYSCPHAQR